MILDKQEAPHSRGFLVYAKG
ncbi:hypothetical protein BN1263500142 [Stenotrophomonas indicatrix]|nr:hypothetical protein BN1263500142 [Stenotrophomonas indicatrix]